MKSVENSINLKNSAYHETKRHSDTMFAFNVYPCTIPVDFPFVPLHWQDSMEIIYIKRGNGLVQVNFESFHAQADDIFLVLPGHLHGLRGISKQRMEYENIIFDMNFLGSENVDICSQKYLQPLLSGKIHFPVHIGKDSVLHDQVSSCLDASDALCANRPQGYELGVKGQLMLLFSVLFQETTSQEHFDIESIHMQKLKMVLARIEKDYDKKLTVADMAEECGYSSSHFMRWFKEATGSGFSAYLIEYRLGKAAQALQSGNDSILEISEQTGFDNLSNFNGLFKKRFDMTPGQFRRQKL